MSDTRRTVVLPAYNESQFIETMINWTVEALGERDETFEVIVVDNASSDGMAEVVKGISERDPRIRLIVHEENKLYAGSCLTGAKAARGERIFILDSDGQHDPNDVWRFDAELDSGCDIAFGWRRRRSEPKLRLAMSKVLWLLARVIIGYRLHDVNCGIRGFTSEFAQTLKIEHRVNLVNPELYARAKIGGYRIGEVQVEQQGRKGGVSSHDFAKLTRILRDVVSYLFALRKSIKASRA